MDPTGAVLPAISAAPIPLWLCPSVQLLYGITAVTRSKPLTIFAIIYGLYWLVKFGIHPPAGDYLSAYISGSVLFGDVMRTINATLIQEPEDFERKKDAEKDGDGRSPRRFRQTVFDCLEVGFMANRGVGWNWQLRTVPPSRIPPGYPRWKFALRSLAGAAIRLLAVDATNLYIRSTPLGTYPVPASYAAEPLHVRMGHAWLNYLAGRWSMDAYYRISAGALTGFGVYSPQDWPPFFGSWKDAYTVRRFWSHTWHQRMRSIAQFPTNLAAASLRLPRASKATFYFKASGAFLFAYALHGYGSRVAGASHTADLWRYGPQVPAILLEECVVAFAAASAGWRGGPGARLLGYLWVVCFQGFTLMWWQAEAARMGVYARPPFGFSLVGWAAGRLVDR